jgi:dipeptidase
MSGLLFFPILLAALPLLSQVRPAPRPAWTVQSAELEGEGCTSVMVARLASADGSTMTSHSCDSGSDRTWMNLVPRTQHTQGARAQVWVDPKVTRGPQDADRKLSGEIPQVGRTYGYLNAAYPIMNEAQLAIGETTIGGRRELVSKAGILDAPELFRLALERARSAREAIRIIDELTRKHGYNDAGESFTFADPKEVWLFEIYGPGADKVGAVWAAQRVPDGEVSVSANASRIRTLDLKNGDSFMASSNVTSLARERGWWKEGEAFDFAYAYAPASRASLGCRRREWRVLSLLAPSLKLDPNSENYPFSVRPDKPVGVRDVLAVFRDAYEGTDFDQTAGLIKEDKGQALKSPVANPFAQADLKALLKVKRERTIAVPQATYVQVTQSRAWLPDAIGGLVWLGYDNPATTPHLPFYAGITRLPVSYGVDGRREYRRDCAWWAFRTPSKLAHFRYQEMSQDILQVMTAIEGRVLDSQAQVEAEALRLYKESPAKAQEFLTQYCVTEAEKAVEAYWKLGDQLWQKYSGRF